MDQFCGVFVPESSENLDSYFKAKGIGWMVRKIIITAMNLSGSGKRTIANNGDDTYTMINDGTSRNSFNWKFKLGETFQSNGFDGKQHEVMLELEGDRLLEHQSLVDDKSKKDEYYYIIQGDYLIWVMIAEGGVEGKWKMKKQ